MQCIHRNLKVKHRYLYKRVASTQRVVFVWITLIAEPNIPLSVDQVFRVCGINSTNRTLIWGEKKILI